MWITQKSASQLYIDHTTNFSTTFQSEIATITGLSLSERNLAITNQKNITIYKIPRPDEFQDSRSNRNLSIKMVNNFVDPDCSQMFLFEENLVVVGHEKVRIYSFGGIVLNEITFNNNEGNCYAVFTNHFKIENYNNICLSITYREAHWSIINQAISNHFHNEWFYSRV